MVNSHAVVLRIFVAVIFCLTLAQPAHAGHERTLKGEVLDVSDNPIPNAHIVLYRGDNRFVIDGWSEDDGTYEIIYDDGDTLSLITYKKTSYIAASVRLISGSRDSDIPKVLKKEGEKLSVSEALDALATLEAIYYVERARETTTDELKKEYASMILKLTIPKEISVRYDTIKALYDVGK